MLKPDYRDLLEKSGHKTEIKHYPNSPLGEFTEAAYWSGWRRFTICFDGEATPQDINNLFRILFLNATRKTTANG